MPKWDNLPLQHVSSLRKQPQTGRDKPERCLTGLQSPGTIPPVNMMLNGQYTPAKCPSMSSWTSPRAYSSVSVDFKVKSGETRHSYGTEKPFRCRIMADEPRRATKQEGCIPKCTRKDGI